ncbi:hypothetical protein F5I97DRAFT_1277573 [Phlebopus sp. FC_14]|nr:hypothetical protein F5I97DRAFT_1277573 [Phlebopus sp. FC_14]
MSSSPLLSVLQASLTNEYLFCASCTLVLYDHLITFDQEIDFFWSEKWNVSSLLYMASRYLADTEVLLLLAIYAAGPTFAVSSSHISAVFEYSSEMRSCKRLEVVVVAVAGLAMLVNQAVICLRVWYLFAHNKVIRVVVTVIYIVCMTAIVTLLFTSLGVSPVPWTSCGRLNHIKTYWHIYLPAVLLHSVLYIFTVCRTVGNMSWRGLRGTAEHFVAEGGPMYLVATCALLYSFIGATFTKDPQAYMPAAQSYFPNSLVAIAVCHAMLSIRTLAARLDVDPTWLLSHSELSRIRWKRGPEGEVVVDCELARNGDVELAPLSM